MTPLRRTALVAAVLALSAFRPATPDGGTLTLINDSDLVITHVYVQPCEQPTWDESEELLGDDVVLGVDEEVVFDVPAGCWDLRATLEDDAELDTISVEVADGDALEWVVTNQEDGF